MSAVSTNDVWAVSTTAVGSMIFHWDGANWNIVPAPTDSASLGDIVAISTNDVWVVGSKIAHWNGQQWQTFAIPSNYYLSGVDAASANDVWAVGEGHNSTVYTVTMHWDGNEWRPDGYGFGVNRAYLSAVAAISANDVWAVGARPYCGRGCLPGPNPLIAHWNGDYWTTSDFPYRDTGWPIGWLSGVTAFSHNHVWAVGFVWYYNDIDTTRGGTIFYWDNRQWRVIPSPSIGTRNYLWGIAAIPRSGVWAVGTYSNLPYGDRHTLILHASWRPRPPDAPTLVSPADAAMVEQPTVALSWQCANRTDWYEVIVRQGSVTGPVADERLSLMTTHYTTRSLKRGQTYYWRVQACNTTQCQPSVWRRFIVR